MLLHSLLMCPSFLQQSTLSAFPNPFPLLALIQAGSFGKTARTKLSGTKETGSSDRLSLRLMLPTLWDSACDS